MIPRTYPTTYVTANGKQQMVVFFLSSVTGLQRFKDYIPVSFPQYGNQKDNSYDNSGVVLVDVLSSSSGRQAWKDYIPVFVESNAADAWRVSINGYIPVGLATAPTLALDFTSSSQTLDPRVTFSRTSNATVTDSSGTLRYAPHNLLTFSEQFDNAAWVKANLSITANSLIAPDNTITGDSLIENTATSTHSILQTATITANTLYVFSLYIKATTGAQRFCRFQLQDGSGTTGVRVIFNPTNGTIATAAASFGSGSSASASITAVGNGWYRATLSGIVDTTSTSISAVLFLQNTSTFVATYTGDGSSGLHIWGAQFNISNMVGGVTSSLSTYYPTTVKNLVGFSEDFANAAWTKSNVTISANVETAPNGTLTADKLVENTVNTSHFITVASAPTTTASSPKAISIYVKGAERTFCRLRLYDNIGLIKSAAFNLSTGVITFENGTGTATITFIGSGWYRIFVTGTTAATATSVNADLYLRSDINTESYTGDGTSGIYIWGAQLSDSASLDTYVNNPLAAPSSTAYYGPRFDYDPTTLAPRGLLIEEQRSNLILQSNWAGAVAGSPGTAPTSWTIASTGSPSLGVANAQYGSGFGDLALTFNCASTERLWVQQTINVTSGVQYAVSVWVESVSGSAGAAITAVAGTATVTINQTVNNPTSPDRYTLLFTANSTGTVSIRYGAGTTSGVSGSVSIRLSRPQVEAGAFATSYIPTTTATATRNADVASITGSNFSGLYNQNEGSVYSDCARSALIPSGSFANLWSISDNTANERYIVYNTGSSGTMDAAVTDNSSGQATLVATGAITANSSIKTLFSYKVNDFAFVRAAGTVQTDTSGSIPTVDRLYIGANSTGGGQWTGTISKIAYYPKRLTNIEIQNLTA